MPTTKLVALMCTLTFCSSMIAMAEERQEYGPRLEGFDYPYKTETFRFTGQGQPLEMVFMDIAADKPNGETVVLLHGKNFCGATWETTIKVLNDAGYRVIAPDQIGFCKSSKPDRYQFSFHQLAENTKALLKQQGIEKATVIGHSMGGMLGARFALMYPESTGRMVLVNPIGLEDWKAQGVPYQSIDAAFAAEKRTTFDSIKSYQQKFYYSGQWKPEYDRWVGMSAGMYQGSGGAVIAWNQALTSDMVFTQPVVHEFNRIKVPTVMMIGMTDKTAPGANRAPDDIAKKLGDYTQLGKTAAAAIPNAKLVEFEDLGHSPQIQDPDRFHDALLESLRSS
ncbi:alpha/beta hydrolase [Phyllobacterium sp. 0TCS1.6C]|uniref:alpha/beta fold hydrolase n=1 Tax=unclassified Phyllobacterium TaxID=2638441 RepID=UPI0022647BD5|nr:MULTISPECIES: alpha/beta hydrolase [unclassified Phyllobacterium]MCX8278942.1 alpha/beta hydrolase [Phyllobacterium sp. 0TCS1.6C]MCX8293726.1 alpha/beta hydrolase [Phyllobacterium sp. 0TCS1.6A]